MTFEGDNNFYVSVNLKRVQSPKPNTVSLHKLVFFGWILVFFLKFGQKMQLKTSSYIFMLELNE